jgi:hypothetical protein
MRCEEFSISVLIRSERQTGRNAFSRDNTFRPMIAFSFPNQRHVPFSTPRKRICKSTARSVPVSPSHVGFNDL